MTIPISIISKDPRIEITPEESNMISKELIDQFNPILKEVSSTNNVNILIGEASSSDSISWVASWLGIFGGLLVSFPQTILIGFGLWVFANSLWITYGKKHKNKDIIKMNGFFLITSIIGLIVHSGIVDVTRIL